VQISQEAPEKFSVILGHQFYGFFGELIKSRISLDKILRISLDFFQEMSKNFFEIPELSGSL